MKKDHKSKLVFKGKNAFFYSIFFDFLFIFRYNDKGESMQERLEWLLEKDIDKLTNHTVLIIGLGGVGCYTVELLARSGIKHLILVDHDTIDITNINRQLIALNSTTDRFKTEVWEERIYDINPHCQVTTITDFITEHNLPNLFIESIDYVVDACDTLDTKVAIIQYCLDHKIPFVSSMGMANRLDASQIKMSVLSKTYNDPLARKLRTFFKYEKRKIPVVFSEEPPKKQIKLGSIAHVPAQAGLLIANYLILDMLKGENHETGNH